MSGFVLSGALFGLGGASLACPTAAHAQAADSSATTVELRISEQSMTNALQEFALQTGKQIIFFSNDASNLRAGPVRGRFTERAALDRLLKGSGLEAVYINSRTIGIGRRDAQGRFIGAWARSQGEATAEPDPVPGEGTLIVVTGRLLDAELSTEEKRDSAQIEDVITADEASQLPDKNIAETIARLPGVSLIRNGETGDGAYVSIRGLDSALANIQFNGVNSGQANGLNRAIPLEGVTSDNVSEIRIAKSLLPADDGSGIGGLVNIVSRTPLRGGEDRITIDGSLRYGEFSEKTGFDAAATITRILNDDFGVNLAASFRRRFVHTFDIDATNSYLAYIENVSDGNGQVLSAAELAALGLDTQSDWRNYIPGEFGPDQIAYEQHSYQIQQQIRDTLSLSGAADWRPTATTLITASGRVSVNRTDGVEWMLGFDEDGGDMVLEGDRLVATWTDLELDYEAQNEHSKDVSAIALLKGVTDTDRLTLSWQASYALARSENPQSDLVFNSAQRFDRGRTPPLSYHDYTFIDDYFPVPSAAVTRDSGLAAALQDIAGAVELAGWRTFEITSRNDRYAGRFDATWKANLDAFGGTLKSIAIGGKFERSDVYSFFDYIQSTATRLNVDGSYSGAEPGDALGRPLSQFPDLLRGTIGFSQIGAPLAAVGIQGIPQFDRDRWDAFDRRFRQTFLASGAPYFSRNFFDGREEILAGYGQLEFEAGRFQLIAGARVERYEGTFLTPLALSGQVRLASLGEPVRTLELTPSGAAMDTLATTSRNIEVLPRLAATFELTSRFKLRFGVTQAIARPTYAQLGNATSVSLSFEASDPSGVILPGVSDVAGAVAAGGLREDQIDNVALSVASGNPDLANAKASSLDLSLEWYPRRGTAITVGAFYKSIDNFIFLGAESTGTALDVDFVESLLSPDARALLASVGGIGNLVSGKFNPVVSVARPVNGERATLTGVEVSLTHRFDWLPGPLSHLGFNGHVTYLDSDAQFFVTESLEAEEALVVLGFYRPGDALPRRSSFYRAPRFTGAASLFYDDGTLEAAISTTFQTASFDATDDFGLDQYTAAYRQLDLFLGYAVPFRGGSVKAFFEVADLLDNGKKGTDVQTVGKQRVSYDESSFNGREFRVGIRSRF